MSKTYSSQKLTRELSKQFGDQVRPVKIEMKYTKEVGAFIRKMEEAHRATANSKLVFK
ncbi:MAG: hypothetical protein WCI51_14295 [Lentisphaerota bacterium]